jgi:hypothetical protein
MYVYAYALFPFILYVIEIKIEHYEYELLRCLAS